MNKSRKTPEQLININWGVPVLAEKSANNLFTDPRYRTNTHHPHYLSQGFTVSLDVVGSPKDRQWFPAICHRFQPVDDLRADPPQFWLKVQQLLWELIGDRGRGYCRWAEHLLRIGSPPGPGMTYSPSRPLRLPVRYQQRFAGGKFRYSNRGLSE